MHFTSIDNFKITKKHYFYKFSTKKLTLQPKNMLNKFDIFSRSYVTMHNLFLTILKGFLMKTKLLLAALGLSSSLAFADSFNIGYINVDRVMAEATPAKTITTAIQAKFSAQQAQLTQLNQKVMSEESGLIAIQNKAPTFEKLSKADQKSYKAQSEVYNKDKATFVQQYGQYQQQVSATEQYALSAFLKQSYKVLTDLGTKNKLDLVLTSNQLVYAKAKYDLTDQLLASIDKMDVSDIVAQVKNGPKAPQATPAQTK